MEGIPVVNINGTSKEVLIAERMKARDAVGRAMKELAECAPNARDYQTAPAGQYEAARKIYEERFRFLDRLYNELLDEAVALDDQ